MAALVLSLTITPTAFAKSGSDRGNDRGGNDRGRNDDKHSVPNCNRGGGHDDDDWDDDDGGPRDHGEAKLTCPRQYTLVSIDQKICPEKPGRPAVTRKRVCCKYKDRGVRCRPFRPCPPRSHS